MHTIKDLETFFSINMPSTKSLIESMWTKDRSELIAILNEYTKMFGQSNYGYVYFVDMLKHAKFAPHEYTDPWKVL